MDRMIEIARFLNPSEAYTLISYLKSEGIDCYLRNEITTSIYPYLDPSGGARVEILEENLERALQVMHEGGFETSSIKDKLDFTEDFDGKKSLLSFLSLEQRILLIIILVIGTLAIIVYLNSILGPAAVSDWNV